MRKIKILQIGGNTQKNGINAHLLNLYRLLWEDFSFVFINTAFRESDPEVRKTIEELGGKIYHLPYAKDVSDIEIELKSLIAAEQPDVIHCHYFFSNGDFMRIGFETDIPARITHCHNDKTDFVSDEDKLILERSRELTEKYATIKLAGTQNAGKFFYGDYKFDVCYASVETKKYYPIADKAALLKKFELDERFKYSLFVGRFAYQKNVMFFVNVMKSLPDRKLIMVGEGNDKAEFIKRIAQAGTAHQFIFMPDTCMNELYNIADSFLLPSRYEGFGLVLVEAQIAGTPCFASDLIPRDADLGIIEFLPLKSDVWIEKLKNHKRIEKPVNVAATRFAVETIASQLRDYYTAGGNLGEEYNRLAKEYSLGSVRRYGDRERAAEGYKRAYELGNIRGSFYYALHLFEGQGVTKDINQAESIVGKILSIVEKNAALGHVDYILILADMLSFGLGAPQSFEKAGELYANAAQLGSVEAMCNLGYMYSVGQGVEKDGVKSFQWYKQSAEGEYLHSMRDVGQCYYFGLDTKVDYSEAVMWFKKAATQNYSHATCDLALCYLEGRGVKKNLVKAAECYLLALKQDQPRAIRDIITQSIDVDELLQNGKIEVVKRDKIESVDSNVFANGTIVISGNIKSIDPAVFYNHIDIIKFFAEKENPYYKAYSGVLYSKDGEILVRFPLGSPATEFVVPTHVQRIGANAFQNCRNLQRIILHDGIETIGDSAFDDCKSLLDIKLPPGLKSVGPWAFHACDRIKNLFVPASLETIGLYAFGSCESLLKITVADGNPSYASLGGNLYSKDLSVLLQYAIGKLERLFVLPSQTKAIAFRAFSDVFRLEYVDAFSVRKIEEKAFYYDIRLKQVLLNNNCEIIGDKVFDHTAEGFTVLRKNRGRILVVADIHGHIRLDFFAAKLKEIKPTVDDVIVILGDAGIVWQEPMREDVRTFYQSLPCDVLFLDGNHENFDLLSSLRIVEKYGGTVHEVLPNVFHLQRGNAYIINGKKCFVFGGAYSRKRETDSSPVMVWDAELPTAAEYQRGSETIVENDNSFDLVFTHQAPRSVLEKIEYDCAVAEAELLDYLDRVKMDVKFGKWLFGHIHNDIEQGNFIGLYDKCEVIE